EGGAAEGGAGPPGGGPQARGPSGSPRPAPPPEAGPDPEGLRGDEVCRDRPGGRHVDRYRQGDVLPGGAQSQDPAGAGDRPAPRGGATRMMCAEVRARIAPWRSGEIDQDDRRLFEEHLAACSAVAAGAEE